MALLDRAKAADLRVLGRVCALPAGIVERGVADDEDRERQDERAGGEDQDAEIGDGLVLHDDHVPGQRSDGDVGEKARYDAKRTMQDYICGL